MGWFGKEIMWRSWCTWWTEWTGWTRRRGVSVAEAGRNWGADGDFKFQIAESQRGAERLADESGQAGRNWVADGDFGFQSTELLRGSCAHLRPNWGGWKEIRSLSLNFLNFA